MTWVVILTSQNMKPGVQTYLRFMHVESTYSIIVINKSSLVNEIYSQRHFLHIFPRNTSGIRCVKTGITGTEKRHAASKMTFWRYVLATTPDSSGARIFYGIYYNINLVHNVRTIPCWGPEKNCFWIWGHHVHVSIVMVFQIQIYLRILLLSSITIQLADWE